jgi:hypothetical protein
VTDRAGLYFVGMPWMPSLKTGTLIGVGAFAEHIAGCIADSAQGKSSAGTATGAMTDRAPAVASGRR